MRHLIWLLLLVPGLVRADWLPPAYDYVRSGTPRGEYYVRVDAGKRVASMCRVGKDGKDEVLWRLEDWYAYECFVHEGEKGPVLIELERRPSGEGPDKTHRVVAFYRDGKLLKAYSTAELVKDPSKVKRSSTLYRYLHPAAEPRLGYIPFEDGMRLVFELTTCDGWIWCLDPDTGEVVVLKKRA